MLPGGAGEPVATPSLTLHLHPHGVLLHRGRSPPQGAGAAPTQLATPLQEATAARACLTRPGLELAALAVDTGGFLCQKLCQSWWHYHSTAPVGQNSPPQSPSALLPLGCHRTTLQQAGAGGSGGQGSHGRPKAPALDLLDGSRPGLAEARQLLQPSWLARAWLVVPESRAACPGSRGDAEAAASAGEAQPPHDRSGEGRRPRPSAGRCCPGRGKAGQDWGSAGRRFCLLPQAAPTRVSPAAAAANTAGEGPGRGRGRARGLPSPRAAPPAPRSPRPTRPSSGSLRKWMPCTSTWPSPPALTAQTTLSARPPPAAAATAAPSSAPSSRAAPGPQRAPVPTISGSRRLHSARPRPAAHAALLFLPLSPRGGSLPRWPGGWISNTQSPPAIAKINQRPISHWSRRPLDLHIRAAANQWEQAARSRFGREGRRHI